MSPCCGVANLRTQTTGVAARPLPRSLVGDFSGRQWRKIVAHWALFRFSRLLHTQADQPDLVKRKLLAQRLSDRSEALVF